jgi:hypothetical protein
MIITSQSRQARPWSGVSVDGFGFGGLVEDGSRLLLAHKYFFSRASPIHWRVEGRTWPSAYSLSAGQYRSLPVCNGTGRLLRYK